MTGVMASRLTPESVERDYRFGDLGDAPASLHRQGNVLIDSKRAVRCDVLLGARWRDEGGCI